VSIPIDTSPREHTSQAPNFPMVKKMFLSPPLARLLSSPLLLLTILSSLLPSISCGGEEAVIVYSRDSNCQGKEMIRAYTSECKQFYANDDAAMDYFNFQCDKKTNTLSLVQYLDKDCLRSVGNVSILLQLPEDADPGSCQTLGEENSNYHSAQLFCGGISAIDNPKTFFSAFESEKVMFRHFTNSDDTCSNKPSVIELVSISLSLSVCLSLLSPVFSSVHSADLSLFPRYRLLSPHWRLFHVL
jgi:hypothetical protein